MARWRPAASSLRAAFIAASVTWALLLVAAPFAASRPHVSPLVSVLVIGVYGIGSLVCHQLPERSYHLWAAQMPVCARCTGIYVGAAVSVIFATLFRTAETVRHAAAVRHSRPPVAEGRSRTTLAQGFSPARGTRLALAVAVAPALLTLLYEWMTGVMPSHVIRAASGVPIGLIVAWLVVAAADNQVN